MAIDLSPVDLAYMAGLIDGEGSITIRDVKSTNSTHKAPCLAVLIAVHMVEPAPLYWLAEKLGGTVQFKQRSKNPNARPSYRWTITGKKAIALCRQMLPYLRVKNGHAAVAIRYQDETKWERKAGAPVPVDELERRRQLQRELQRLNRRGVDAYAN